MGRERTVLRVALTGSIATGKSHCLERFARLGAPVIDADAVAREVLAPGTPGIARVRERFGPAFVDDSGRLDRAAMARLVFDDARVRRDLETIVHPLVYRRIDDWFRSLESEGSHALAIADVPLLFETGRQTDFDRVVVAACSPERQRERLIARGHSAEDAERRLAAQLPIEDKVRRADEVIDTSGSYPETDRQVAEVWERLHLAGP